MVSYRLVCLSKLFEQDVLEPFVSNKLFPWIQDGHDVISIFMLGTIMSSGFKKQLNLIKVLTLLQQGDCIILTPAINQRKLTCLLQGFKPCFTCAQSPDIPSCILAWP